VVFAALGAVGFLPLFGGPGYEHSLASGILVPSAAAIAVGLELSAEPALAPLACVGRALAVGASLAAIAFLTALLHGLRVGMCDFWGGTILFALTAGSGSLLGAVWGALVAEVCRGRRRRRLLCVLLGLAAPLLGIVVSAARFYGSPMVFSYDPFFGFFSGTLYDTIVDVRTELWTYRAGSLATLAGVLLVASALGRTDGTSAASPRRGQDLRPGRIARGSGWGCAARLALGGASLLASLVVAIEGPALGHWQTASTIARALGGRASGPRCDVVYPESLLADQASLLLRDCEQQVAADEQRLGAHLEGRLTEFVFRDANEKRRLMGAAETSIAKPWRREVYVQMAAYPHPILGHEVAHVVAGSFARGPFRIAGALGGLWPNPGLIEGIAVAASPDDDELTDAQWARAMLDLGILPPLRSLFSLGFLGENASKSYTVAGAFVAWVLARWDTAVVRGWYGGGSLEALTGKSWSDLEADFHASLRSLPMPPQASAYARARFERPSVWSRRCPHTVDALDRDADRCRDDHSYARAITLYAQALERDPHDWHALLAHAKIQTFFLDNTRGRGDLERLAREGDTPRTWRDRAQEALADDDLLRGFTDRAEVTYGALAGSVLDEDVARTLEVKALAAKTEQLEARRAVVDLLVGQADQPGRPVDAWLGGVSLGEWAGATHEPLASYLVGKNLALHEDYARAAAWLDKALDALDAGAPTQQLPGRVRRELLRERARTACALEDEAGLVRVRHAVEQPGSPFEGTAGGRREWVLRLIARCRR
jgi:hypothetical protein